MRILVGISYFTPNISGLTIYAENLAEGLSKKSHEIEIIASQHLRFLPKGEIKGNNIFIKRVWTPLIFGRGPIMPTYPIEAFFSVVRSDVVNCHIPQFEAVFLCLWAKLFGKKIVLTHHCDLSNWPGLINQITEKITYMSLLAAGFFADKIVVYTKDYADSSKYLSHFKSKLVYILPPVRVQTPPKDNISKYKNIKYKIGFAGRIAREKGITYLLETIPLLEKKLQGSFKIFLAGPSEEVIGGSYEKEIEYLLRKYKNYIVYLGPLSQKQMAGFYGLIDVLVLPSIERLESFGFVQVEAFLSGCPVVASKIPGVRMPIRLSGMGKTVPIKNVKELARSILEILEDRRKFVKPKKRIEKIFNFEKTINEYEKLFKNLS